MEIVESVTGIAGERGAPGDARIGGDSGERLRGVPGEATGLTVCGRTGRDFESGCLRWDGITGIGKGAEEQFSGSLNIGPCVAMSHGSGVRFGRCE